jgi:hypothetical protein
MPDIHFSRTYAEARDRFLQLASQAHARVTSFELPEARGPRDEALTTDIAWVGPESPRGVIILTSGTHGVEGFAGSGFQCWLLGERAAALPGRDIAIVLVHAVNPFGFAHIRRVNENNIDLNRNFIDFSRPLPQSGVYQRLHAAIVPSRWSGKEKQQADDILRESWHVLGERGFQDAVCRGQYAHCDGLFYGGRRPSWSHRTWRACLANLPSSIELLAHIDVHTGLGPFSQGEIVYTLAPDCPGLALAKEWFTDLGLRTAGSSDSTATLVEGTMNHAVVEAAPPRTMSISIEFGTVEFRRMFAALRADNWLHARASEGFPAAAQIREELLNCFYPADVGWKEALVRRCDEVVQRAMAGMDTYLRKDTRTSEQ